ncbi:sey1 [Coccidioides immitis RMSCC 3703]|uniref:Sey1 n=1 Tax=Coccidioides immitis RMSCC 3703 TaxID=454286 RepID=A0A0J8R1I6_COCIT|nr:sey1 [Coccidioides immitis RMSCC 3703]
MAAYFSTIERLYTKARESTLTLIPLLSRFRLQETNATPQLDRWVGYTPSAATPADEEDLVPIGGVDDDGKSLEEEMTMLSETKRQDLTVRFKKAADGVYVEAKRSAIGGMTQIPVYFYILLLALGWNEIIAAYIIYQLNLWGPMVKMAEAASHQAVEEGKKRLRDLLEPSDIGHHGMKYKNGTEQYEMSHVRSGRNATKINERDDDDEVEGEETW